jgi:hypothetical protein
MVKLWYINTVEYYSALKNNDIFYCKMDGTSGHFVKWNKSDTER